MPRVTFAAGDDSESFEVTVGGEDYEYEPGETLAIAIDVDALPEGYVTGAHPRTVITVGDEEDSPDLDPEVAASFSAEPASAPEGGAVEVVVTLDRMPERPVVLGLVATPDSTLGADEHGAVPEELAFGPLDTERRFTVRFEDDAEVEGEETLTLAFGTPTPSHKVALGDELVLTVLDDDGPPAVPEGLAATPGDGFVSLAWEAVVNDAPVERYEVRWRAGEGASSGLPWADAGVARTYRVEGLANGTEYRFEVRAVNVHGEGGAASVTATPSAKAIAVPKAWLARFGRTAAGHVTEAIGARLGARVGAGSQLTLGGHRVSLGARPGGPGSDTGAGLSGRRAGDGSGRAEDGPRGMTGGELLLGSSFHLALGGDGAGALRWTGWGRGAGSRFDAKRDGLALDGEVTTFALGADAARERWLAGVALALSVGEGRYRVRGDGGGELESSLASVHPYVRVDASERLSVWGTLGFGTGKLALALDGGESWRSDATMETAAVGARGVLVRAAGAGRFELAARTDAQLVRMTSDAATGSEGGALAGSDARTSRVRLLLEGSRRFAVGEGGALTPTVELGLREDRGDAETGTGLELGGGVSYTDPARGLVVTAKARTLLAHEDADYREWGASGSVRIDPGATGRGLSLTLAPAWGAAGGGAGRLWGLRDARDLAPDAEPGAESRLEAELGYGFPALGGRGVATPYAGLSRSETGGTLRLGQRLELGRASEWRVENAFGEDTRELRAGYGYRLGPDLELGLDATRREPPADAAPEHGVMFRARLRW